MKSIGAVDPAAPTIGRFTLTGPTEITLRNGTTGRSATLAHVGLALGRHAERGASRSGAARSGSGRPESTSRSSATNGKGSFVAPHLVLSPGPYARACDRPVRARRGPRAAVDGSARRRRRRGRCRATRSARSATPGSMPLLGRVIRHDHVHLDVIVNGRDGRRFPAAIGLAEPVDGGPCPPGAALVGRLRAPARRSSPRSRTRLCTPTPRAGSSTSSPTGRTRTRSARSSTSGACASTASCVGGYCTGGGKELRVYVDGRRVTGDPREGRAARTPADRGRLRRQRLRLGAVPLHGPLARAGLRRAGREVVPA